MVYILTSYRISIVSSWILDREWNEQRYCYRSNKLCRCFFALINQWNNQSTIQLYIKGKMQVSDIKSEDLSSDFTSYPLVIGPVHSCAISTPRRAYSPAAVSAHWTYCTHCHLCPTRYSFLPESSEAFEGEVSCLRTQHLNNVPRLRGEKHLFLWKFCTKRDSKTHGRQRHRQSATI